MADDIIVGAKQIPNPKGIKVLSDTDNPPVNPAGRDISNPVKNEMEPEHHKYSADPFEMHGIRSDTPRHPIGRGIPKNHPAIQESEN